MSRRNYVVVVLATFVFVVAAACGGQGGSPTGPGPTPIAFVPLTASQMQIATCTPGCPGMPDVPNGSAFFPIKTESYYLTLNVVNPGANRTMNLKVRYEWDPPDKVHTGSFPEAGWKPGEVVQNTFSMPPPFRAGKYAVVATIDDGSAPASEATIWVQNMDAR